MEGQLAELSDIVIIIVESAGTFAELGAFSNHPTLRRTLLPIVDARYQKETTSFLSTGPLAWVNARSIFAPTIYADFSVILESVADIEARLERIPTRSRHEVQNLSRNRKYLLFLVCDLVAVIGPASTDLVLYYVHRLVGGAVTFDITGLLELGVAVNLLSSLRQNKDTLYYRPLTDGQFLSFSYPRGLNFDEERAKHVSVLQRIREAQDALDAIASNGRG